MIKVHHEFQKANAISIHDCGVKQAKDTYAVNRVWFNVSQSQG
jgi:hypothetical protein